MYIKDTYHLWGAAERFCESESQGLIIVRTAEFMGPKQTKIGTLKGGLFNGHVCKENMVSILEPHNSVCPRFCPDLLQDLSLARWGQLKFGEWVWWTSMECVCVAALVRLTG